jgi:AraC-like DNA-binding protein
VLGGQTDRIARAIQRLRTDFDKPLRIESLAFQKQLRLQEARRLLLGEDIDATTAAYRVGYEDASHFSREYKRLFGNPPMRDIELLRASG